MSNLVIKFQKEPTPEELEKMNKAIEKFAGVAVEPLSKTERLIAKAKNDFDIKACRVCESYRHSEIMKAIRKREREIKKAGGKK